MNKLHAFIGLCLVIIILINSMIIYQQFEHKEISDIKVLTQHCVVYDHEFELPNMTISVYTDNYIYL